MNIITQNGKKIVQTSEYIEVDGVRTPLPKHVKSCGNSMRVVGGTITINGYRFDPVSKTFTKAGFSLSRILKSLFE
jgi:hypothetical protein